MLIEDFERSMVNRFESLSLEVGESLKGKMKESKLYLPQRVEVELEGFEITFEDYVGIDEGKYESLVSECFKVRKARFLEKKGHVHALKQEFVQERNIELSSAPGRAEEAESNEKKASFREQYVFMAVIVLLIAIYLGIK